MSIENQELYQLKNQASILAWPSKTFFQDSQLLAPPEWSYDRKPGFSESCTGFAENELISQETASAAL